MILLQPPQPTAWDPDTGRALFDGELPEFLDPEKKAAEARAAEEAEQAKHDDFERRRLLAQERIRREREEAEISGTLPPEAELFLTGRLKPLIREAHDFVQKVRVPIVQGLLFQDSLAWVAGQSGTFKSFITADLAFRYGSDDMDYHGMRMTHGRALIVVAEGAAGYADRKTAWEKQHGREVKNVSIYPGALQLGDVQKEMPALLAYLREEKEAGRGFGLIIFDTQAMCTVGIDENKSEINLVINVMHRIRETSGACVLTVHHFGKTASAGMRGSSMLYAAADTVCIVKRKDDTMEVTLSTAQSDEGKQKDAPTAKDFLTLDLLVHDVGEDYFGDAITSLVPVQQETGSHDAAPDADSPPLALDPISDKLLFWLRVLNTFERSGANPGQMLDRISDPPDDWDIVPPRGYTWNRQTPRNRMLDLQKKGYVFQRPDKLWEVTPRGVARLARSMADRYDRALRKGGSGDGSEPLELPDSEPSGT